MNKTKNVPLELQKMLYDYYLKVGKKDYTTNSWVDSNNIRITKLLKYGYKKFKRTVANTYCQWLVEPDSPEIIKLIKSQINFLTKHLSEKEIYFSKQLARKLPVFPHRIKEFNFITLLLWHYVKRQGLQKELAQLSEPPEGSPLAINFRGRLISQTLAHSLLEYDTIIRNIKPNSVNTILSIGPGFGRTAYVWMRLRDVEKYIFVDLPPSLYLAQRYLSNQFPEKKIFKYRNFNSFREIQDEYNKANMVFLMPWQIEMLPEKSIDLVYAIESVDEMNMKIINKYIKIINKIGKKYLYIKTWKQWKVEDNQINYKDILFPNSWKVKLKRTCRVVPESVELLYQLSHKKANDIKAYAKIVVIFFIPLFDNIFPFLSQFNLDQAFST